MLKRYLWLGRQDSNLRMLGPKPSALPLGDDPLLSASMSIAQKGCFRHVPIHREASSVLTILWLSVGYV